MAEVRQTIKEHYNQHVQDHLTTKEALQRRREGPAAPLKKYHNDIKRRLIYRFAYRASALLDLACGRGGDIHKWASAQVHYVKGYDLSDREVAEAQRRYAELKQKSSGHLQAHFQQTDQLGLSLLKEDRQYDVATCMFALHYFFEKEAVLKTFMETVAANIKPGGYFIGCLPDGKRVKAHLKAEGHLQMPHLVLRQLWEGKDAPFGSAYIMEIPDTVVEGHEGLTQGSHEYLVFEKVLLQVAKLSGLHPVLNYGDPGLDALFEEGDMDKPVKHFNPHYPSDTDNSLVLASRLYMAFVLQKVDTPADAVAPPLPPPDKAVLQRQRQQHQQQRWSPARRERSPTRAERFASADSGEGQADTARHRQQPPVQQQQQHSYVWRMGPGNRNKLSLEWQLPYPARILPPQDMPSAYFNVRHLAQRAQKGRYIVRLPPLPWCAGPYLLDEYGQSAFVHLPDGRPVNSYYDELNYHADLAAAVAAAAGGGVQPAGHAASTIGNQQALQYPGPPAMQQEKGADITANSKQQSQQQEQQQPLKPDKTAAEDPEAAAGDSSGRGRGRGRGKKAVVAAAADSEAAAPAAAGRGRERGSRGSRAVGSKRARESAIELATADIADGAAAEQGTVGGNAEEQAKQQAVKQEQAAKPAVGGARAAGFAAGRGPIADPLGYKGQTTAQLPEDMIEKWASMAPQYVEK
eukprot:GHRR01005017.1.p1 GENE.GHRR01005017.1~~GHRR01005017.1.p1  ORF type:complete len:690 (+),score=302.69 GHRR01005017.1:350-2419(+)